jgi:hypothetical protein
VPSLNSRFARSLQLRWIGDVGPNQVDVGKVHEVAHAVDQRLDELSRTERDRSRSQPRLAGRSEMPVRVALPMVSGALRQNAIHLCADVRVQPPNQLRIGLDDQILPVRSHARQQPCCLLRRQTRVSQKLLELRPGCAGKVPARWLYGASVGWHVLERRGNHDGGDDQLSVVPTAADRHSPPMRDRPVRRHDSSRERRFRSVRASRTRRLSTTAAL